MKYKIFITQIQIEFGENKDWSWQFRISLFSNKKKKIKKINHFYKFKYFFDEFQQFAFGEIFRWFDCHDLSIGVL